LLLEVVLQALGPEPQDASTDGPESTHEGVGVGARALELTHHVGDLEPRWGHSGLSKTTTAQSIDATSAPTKNQYAACSTTEASGPLNNETPRHLGTEPSVTSALELLDIPRLTTQNVKHGGDGQ
jgi:hypothetical protein